MNKVVLSGLLSVVGFAAAAAPMHGGHGGGRGGGYYCNVPNQAYVDVNRWFGGNNYFDMRQVFGLDQNCNGKRIRNVILYGGADNRGYSQATLYVNNQPYGYTQQISPGNVYQYNFYTDNYYNHLGNEIQSFGLYTQGQVYVQRIAIYMEDDYGPQPQPGPGPGPGPQPGPRPQPQPRQPIWGASAGGGYHDTTGTVQGSALRLPQMRPYGGTFQSGEPVPQYQVLVNSVGQVCAQPGYPEPAFGNCSAVPTHYE
ncbi:MAG: hypothetical protein JST16_06725 [Bdellovibrionales bacterium]|nr:hypothetical protein [Bdellovibrionales bacterium]